MVSSKNEIQLLKSQVAISKHSTGPIPIEVFMELFEYLEVSNNLIDSITQMQDEEQRFTALLTLLNEGIFEFATKIHLQRNNPSKYFEYRCELQKPHGKGVYQSWACKQYCRQCDVRDVRQIKEWESDSKSIASRYVPHVIDEVNTLKQHLIELIKEKNKMTKT
jgi:hypothetical protein